MRKFLVALPVFAVLLGIVYAYPINNQEVEAALCHTDKPVVTDGQDSPQNPPQDPPPPPTPPKPEDDPDYQPDDTQSHRYSPGDGCSRADSEAEPGTKLNGKKRNTVGCVCKKTCVNGQTQEDLTRGINGKYICKNACHKDRCFCPDPCKT